MPLILTPSCLWKKGYNLICSARLVRAEAKLPVTPSTETTCELGPPSSFIFLNFSKLYLSRATLEAQEHKP